MKYFVIQLNLFHQCSMIISKIFWSHSVLILVLEQRGKEYERVLSGWWCFLLVYGSLPHAKKNIDISTTLLLFSQQIRIWTHSIKINLNVCSSICWVSLQLKPVISFLWNMLMFPQGFYFIKLHQPTTQPSSLNFCSIFLLELYLQFMEHLTIFLWFSLKKIFIIEMKTFAFTAFLKREAVP